MRIINHSLCPPVFEGQAVSYHLRDRDRAWHGWRDPALNPYLSLRYEGPPCFPWVAVSLRIRHLRSSEGECPGVPPLLSP